MIRVLEKLQPYENKNYLFLIFLNREILLNMSSPHFKFYILILHILMEGTVSQNFDLGIESRK